MPGWVTPWTGGTVCVCHTVSPRSGYSQSMGYIHTDVCRALIPPQNPQPTRHPQPLPCPAVAGEEQM